MDRFTLSLNEKNQGSERDFEKYYDCGSKVEWQLATGQMNYRSFQLDDWIPTSYLENEDEF